MTEKKTQKKTQKKTRKKTQKKTPSSQRAAAASKLVPILAPRRASKDGCRFRCIFILCAVGRVKADRRVPKGRNLCRSLLYKNQTGDEHRHKTRRQT